ncbi:hypothetical protein B0H10DRAFT_1953453 [Mycena sp. CBHHK59/15]|nr:hypothetical protein B0H10DRAFT_1953453 [Mycena sp. CBHHK59/15]
MASKPTAKREMPTVGRPTPRLRHRKDSEAALRAGRREGVLFRSSEALQRAHNVDVVVFDKTGTLSRGVFSLERTEILAHGVAKIIHPLTSTNDHGIVRKRLSPFMVFTIASFLSQSSWKWKTIWLMSRFTSAPPTLVVVRGIGPKAYKKRNFLFRPPHGRPDVIELGRDGDLLACGGSDGRLNVFSLGRSVHMTSMIFPAPISALSWEPTTLVEIWTLWIGMRDGSLDCIPVAVEDAQEPTPKHVLTVPGGDAVVQITSNKTAVMATTTSQRKILMDYAS